MIDTFNNENCFDTINKIKEKGIKINIVLTSPPYNTSRKSSKDKYMQRYIEHIDILTDEEYIDNTVNLFNGFNDILEKNGVILYNMSYSTSKPYLMYSVISEIIKKTNFVIVDTIVWKKNNAIPDNRSSNRLTRIFEFVFVFARKNEDKSFQSNKAITSLSNTGIYTYTPITNFIEARNNSEVTSLNKATFSVEFCDELLKIYAKKDDIIYDPFMGTGTTAVSAKKNRCFFIGSEICKKQIIHSKRRLKSFLKSFSNCEYRPPVINFCRNRNKIFNKIQSLIPKNIKTYYEINLSDGGLVFNLFENKNYNINNYYIIEHDKYFYNYYNVLKNNDLSLSIEKYFLLWEIANILSNNLFIYLKEYVKYIIENKKYKEDVLINKINRVIYKKKYNNLLSLNNYETNLKKCIMHDINKLIEKETLNYDKLIYDSLVVHTLGVFYKTLVLTYDNETDKNTKTSIWFILNLLRSRNDKFIFGGAKFINKTLTCKHYMMFSDDVKKIFNNFTTQYIYTDSIEDELNNLNFEKEDFILCFSTNNTQNLYNDIIKESKANYIIYNVDNESINTNLLI